MSRRLIAALAMSGLLLAACGDAGGPRQAEVPNEGLQMTGSFGGAQLSVSFGDPDFLETDCDPDDGIDDDWCLVARSIDGALVRVIFENPAHLSLGETLDIDFDRCTTCDDVDTGAVIDVVVNGERKRVSNGTLNVIEVGPRWAMSFAFRFDDGGQLSGEFNVPSRGLNEPDEDLFDSEQRGG